jgi:hypothetical protein
MASRPTTVGGTAAAATSGFASLPDEVIVSVFQYIRLKDRWVVDGYVWQSPAAFHP